MMNRDSYESERDATSRAMLAALSACRSADLTFLEHLTGLASKPLLQSLTRLEEAGIVQIERLENDAHQVIVYLNSERDYQPWQSPFRPFALEMSLHVSFRFTDKKMFIQE